MRRLIFVAVLLASVLSGASVASANGSSPYHLQQIGWTCVDILDMPTLLQGVHCFPPPLRARLNVDIVVMKVFDTHDVNATEARVLGTEIAIPADQYHGQPCPQNSLEEFFTSPLIPGLRTCHHFPSTPPPTP